MNHAQFRELLVDRFQYYVNLSPQVKDGEYRSRAGVYEDLLHQFNKLPDVAAELQEAIDFSLKEKPFTERGEGFRSGVLYMQNILKRINKLKELSK